MLNLLKWSRYTVKMDASIEDEVEQDGKYSQNASLFGPFFR
ncbi:hypothetical protein [Bacillus sp. EB600]|nr:hypothetical protein [Bacillus sp. EB600]